MLWLCGGCGWVGVVVVLLWWICCWDGFVKSGGVSYGGVNNGVVIDGDVTYGGVEAYMVFHVVVAML